MSTAGERSTGQAPILLLNWLADQSDEIDVALQDFGNEVRIQTAKVDNKKGLKEAVQNWYALNPNAQFLYIGCHGDGSGLFRDCEKPMCDRMDYEEFGELLSQCSTPLHLWLGACDSSSLAVAWNKSGKNIPVHYIVGFATKVKTRDVKATLLALLSMTGCDPVTFVDEELPRIRKLFPDSNVLTFYKQDGEYKNTDYLDPDLWP